MTHPRPVPPSLPTAVALQLGIHLRRSLRWRALAPAFALVLASALAGAGLSRSSPQDWELIPTFFSTVLLRTIALLALGFGVGAIRADAEQGALAAFLMRPRAAIALPVARLAAVVAIVSAFALLGTLALFGLASLIALPPDPARLPWQLAAALGAALSYGTIFVFFGAFFRQATAVSLAWLVLLDMGLANVSDRVALICPHGPLAVIAHTPPDAALTSASAWALGAAVVQLLALSAAAAAATVWRLRGDIPD